MFNVKQNLFYIKKILYDLSFGSAILLLINVDEKNAEVLLFRNSVLYLDFTKFETSEKYDIVVYRHAKVRSFIYTVLMRSNTLKA